jgi:hypothetical protein
MPEAVCRAVAWVEWICESGVLHGAMICPCITAGYARPPPGNPCQNKASTMRISRIRPNPPLG